MPEQQTTLTPSASTHSMKDLLPTVEHALLPVATTADHVVTETPPVVPQQIMEGPHAPTERPSMLNFIATALRDPAIDVEKLRALLSMQKELLADDAEAQFNAAMKAAQAEMQPIVRNKENKQTQTHYADLTAVDRAIRAIYTRHGFSVSFSEEPTGNDLMEISCQVSHSPASGGLGHTKRYRLLAPPDTLGPKGAPTKTMLHGRASTNTFLRRCLLANVFNLSYRDQDDDGNLGGAAFITLSQAEEIELLLTQAGADRARFMQYFEVAAITNIRAQDFASAVNMLLTKISKAKAEAAAEKVEGAPHENP